MSEFVCPHCRTALPEQATFCGACGRRIEGWTLPADAPAPGDAPLPDGDQPTRQMDVTPSLLRAAALSLKLKKGGGGAGPPRSRLPLVVAMVVVAAAGGIAGFFLVRGRVHRSRHAPAASAPPSAAIDKPIVAPPAPAPTAAPAPTQTVEAKPKAIVRRDKAGKRAHVIAAAPVEMKRHKKVASSGGLPHKSVATDSRSVAQQQQAEAAQLPTPTPQPPTTPVPPIEADSKEEAQARLDADSIRFVVRAHLPQVRACYGRAFKDSSPGGTVEIGFAIDPTGRARNVRTETNTTDSEGLARCLEARVREWEFPRPVGGDYELIYPFVFAPGS